MTACQMSFSCQHSLSPLPSPPCLPSLSPIPYTQTNMTNKQHNTNQTCLPKNTSVRTTNSLCPYFQIFDWIFLRMHHQSVKTKVTFSIIHFVRTVCELIFSILQTHYTQMTLFVYICESCSRSKTAEHFLQKKNALSVLLSLIPTRPFSNICCLVRDCFLGFVNSSSSSSVSCSHLSPTALNPPYWKMANFHKVSMQIRCSLV